MNPSLCVLFEDSDCLAVVKPAGQFPLGTWAPPGETTLESDVRRHLDPDQPGSVYLGIVHRLDRPTSGVLLWAKTRTAARRLSSQFEKRRVVKEYWAVVAPRDPAAPPPDMHMPAPAPTYGFRADGDDDEIWVDGLTRPSETGTARVVGPDAPNSRRAETRARRMATITAKAPPHRRAWLWLKLWPRTGRTHQLRAQAAARGLPIIGDTDYGAPPETASLLGPPPSIALHARSLQVQHPILQVPLTLTAPVPDAWRALGMPPEIDAS